MSFEVAIRNVSESMLNSEVHRNKEVVSQVDMLLDRHAERDKEYWTQTR